MKEFIGFENIIEGFSKRVRNNHLSHAHLIVGPDGIGKSIVAKIFANKILGKDEYKDYVDIVSYRPKKASLGVDEVRDIIVEVNKKPYEGDKKVIIIHDGNKLTVQAQNALLKTIEEPPKGVYIIILSESLEMMLDTIKSRSQIYKLTPLSKDKMIEFINKLGEKDKNKILAAISYGDGIPGRAERILKDNKLQQLRELIIELLIDVSNNKGTLALEYEEKFNKFKDEKDNILNLIILFIRDIMICKEIENKEKIINIDKYDDILKLTGLLSYKKLNIMIKYTNEARTNLMNNVSYSMMISMMLIGFLED